MGSLRSIKRGCIAIDRIGTRCFRTYKISGLKSFRTCLITTRVVFSGDAPREWGLGSRLLVKIELGQAPLKSPQSNLAIVLIAGGEILAMPRRPKERVIGKADEDLWF